MLFTGPHDYFNRDYVMEWAQSADSRRPFRVHFFDAVAVELSPLLNARVLDLGAGPGFLAEYLLSRSELASYHLFDFSPHMLELSRARLARFEERLSFLQGSFLDDNWRDALTPPYDAVVSIQAVHELRDTSRIPRLYSELRSVLNHNGLVLIADEVAVEDEAGPFHTVDGHLSALMEAGFEEVRQVLAEGDLAMFSARRRQTTI